MSRLSRVKRAFDFQDNPCAELVFWQCHAGAVKTTEEKTASMEGFSRKEGQWIAGLWIRTQCLLDQDDYFYILCFHMVAKTIVSYIIR